MGIVVNFVCDFPGEFALTVGESYPKFLESPIFYKIYASIRIRCLLPLATVGRAIPSRLISYRTLIKSSERFGPDEWFVLFKAGSTSVRSDPELASFVVDFAERHRARVVYDTCDPAHADSDPTVARLQQVLLSQAALVTSASDELAKELAPLTDSPVRTVDDSVDCLPASPKFAPSDQVRIVWFGWMTTARFSDLGNRLASIASKSDRRFACEVLSQDVPPEWLSAANVFLAQRTNRTVRLAHRRWNLPEAWDAIAQSDLALIPHDLAADGTARFKSHNRLTTAIQRGVFAVASPIPAYHPLAEYCWLGGNLAEGVAWALAHPDEVRARIAAGQARVEALYSPETIGARWTEVLKEFVASG